jgi:hypothetical protein
MNIRPETAKIGPASATINAGMGADFSQREELLPHQKKRKKLHEMEEATHIRVQARNKILSFPLVHRASSGTTTNPIFQHSEHGYHIVATGAKRGSRPSNAVVRMPSG